MASFEAEAALGQVTECVAVLKVVAMNTWKSFQTKVLLERKEEEWKVQARSRGSIDDSNEIWLSLRHLRHYGSNIMSRHKVLTYRRGPRYSSRGVGARREGQRQGRLAYALPADSRFHLCFSAALQPKIKIITESFKLNIVALRCSSLETFSLSWVTSFSKELTRVTASRRVFITF